MKTFNTKTVVIGVAVLVALLVGATVYMTTRSQTTPQPEPRDGYVVKGEKVYYRTTTVSYDGSEEVDDYEVKNADTSTFTVLDSYWAKDKGNLFYMGETVLPKEGTPPADFESFAIFDESTQLGKDKNAVYVISSAPADEEGWLYEIIPEADPATFTVLEGPYATDKNNAYYFEWGAVRKIEGVDGSTFNVLGKCAAVEKSTAYYAGDAKSVIVGDTILPEVDRETFSIEVSYDNGYSGMYAAGSYSVDKNHVYKDCGEVTKGNPETCSFFDLKDCE